MESRPIGCSVHPLTNGEWIISCSVQVVYNLTWSILLSETSHAIYPIDGVVTVAAPGGAWVEYKIETNILRLIDVENTATSWKSCQ